MYQDILKKAQNANATLIVVSKTRSIPEILRIYQAGHRVFGENRVQELADKREQLPEDIEWHLIGHLQKNKVKYIASYIKMIHSVDSLELLKVIHKEALKAHRCIDVLLQFHIATEETKFGLDIEEAKAMLEELSTHPLEGVRICGVMGMASFTTDRSQVRQEFQNLKQIFDKLKSKYFQKDSSFKEVSMGMSGDYDIALEEGATLIRVGSAVFN